MANERPIVRHFRRVAEITLIVELFVLIVFGAHAIAMMYPNTRQNVKMNGATTSHLE